MQNSGVAIKHTHLKTDFWFMLTTFKKLVFSGVHYRHNTAKYSALQPAARRSFNVFSLLYLSARFCNK